MGVSHNEAGAPLLIQNHCGGSRGNGQKFAPGIIDKETFSKVDVAILRQSSRHHRPSMANRDFTSLLSIATIHRRTLFTTLVALLRRRIDHIPLLVSVA